jgi:hypothetical protein
MHVPVWSTWPCTICPSRRSPNFMALSRFKLSPTTQFPRFVLNGFANCGYWMRLSFSSTTVKQIPLCNALVYFKFSCNWRVYCNVNIAFVVLISWMVPRVSMIPVNISYFILLNLHFKISNKYTELMKKQRKYNSWNFNRGI